MTTASLCAGQDGGLGLRSAKGPPFPVHPSLSAGALRGRLPPGLLLSQQWHLRAHNRHLPLWPWLLRPGL